jgi:hypothetical protein
MRSRPRVHTHGMRPMKPAPFQAGAGRVMRADGVIGAEAAHAQCLRQVILEVAGLLDPSAERALGIRTACVEEDAVAVVYRRSRICSGTCGAEVRFRPSLRRLVQ